MDNDSAVLAAITKSLRESTDNQEHAVEHANDEFGPNSPFTMSEMLSHATLCSATTKLAYDLHSKGLIDSPVQFMIDAGIDEDVAPGAYAKWTELLDSVPEDKQPH